MSVIFFTSSAHPSLFNRCTDEYPLAPDASSLHAVTFTKEIQMCRAVAGKHLKIGVEYNIHLNWLHIGRHWIKIASKFNCKISVDIELNMEILLLAGSHILYFKFACCQYLKWWIRCGKIIWRALYSDAPDVLVKEVVLLLLVDTTIYKFSLFPLFLSIYRARSDKFP